MTNAKELLNGVFGKESQSTSNVEISAIWKKLQELGVKIIEVYPDKIEFVWMDHICSYKNNTFHCGANKSWVIENISYLDTDGLYRLVGKLTDEQLDRVGNILDLYEDSYNHLLCQQEDMKYVGMVNTDLYDVNTKFVSKYTHLINILQETLQTGELGDVESHMVEKYILKGE